MGKRLIVLESGPGYNSLAEFAFRPDACFAALSRARCPESIIPAFQQEAPMNVGDTEPSGSHGGETATALSLAAATRVTFDRRELNRIFGLYGRKVAAGEWRDYAIDFLRDRAVF